MRLFEREQPSLFGDMQTSHSSGVYGPPAFAKFENLAGVEQDGYRFWYEPGPDGAAYQLIAQPTQPWVSGRASFLLDKEGTFRHCIVEQQEDGCSQPDAEDATFEEQPDLCRCEQP